MQHPTTMIAGLPVTALLPVLLSSVRDDMGNNRTPKSNTKSVWVRSPITTRRTALDSLTRSRPFTVQPHSHPRPGTSVPAAAAQWPGSSASHHLQLDQHHAMPHAALQFTHEHQHSDQLHDGEQDPGRGPAALLPSLCTTPLSTRSSPALQSNNTCTTRFAQEHALMHTSNTKHRTHGAQNAPVPRVLSAGPRPRGSLRTRGHPQTPAAPLVAQSRR